MKDEIWTGENQSSQGKRNQRGGHLKMRCMERCFI